MAHEILRRPSADVQDELDRGKDQPVMTRPAALALLLMGLLIGVLLGLAVFVAPFAR